MSRRSPSPYDIEQMYGDPSRLKKIRAAQETELHTKAAEVLAKAKDATSKREALEDLAWGMMNSLEFLFNH